jgi:type IV secretion system protein VirB4
MGTASCDTNVDRQIVQAPVAWESDHLRIGRRFVQMYSLKTTPEASRPCLFADLLKLDCDSILCSTWRPKSSATARHEIDQQEKFISFFKVGVLSRAMAGKDTASLDTGAGAKAANNAVDDLSDVIRALDKKTHGEFSLRLLVAARSVAELHSISPTVHRVFVEARAQIMEETLGNLSAFYAMFPGNAKFNVFPMWLAEDHHARLSSIYAPNLGHLHSDDLDAEYLNVYETRTGTPFFQDAYVDGVRVQLILGPTGSGKSVMGNGTIAHEQKYGGFTYIFDIGGSYESVVELYGGRVDRIGKDGPRVNPFALEPTESNIQFLYSFIKLLLTNGGAELEPEDDDVIHKAVQDMYLLDAPNRRLSNSVPAEEARPLPVEVGGTWRLQRHLRQRGRQPLAIPHPVLRLPGRQQRAVCRPDRASDGLAVTAHQRCALQPRQSRGTQAHPDRRDLLFDEE